MKLRHQQMCTCSLILGAVALNFSLSGACNPMLAQQCHYLLASSRPAMADGHALYVEPIIVKGEKGEVLIAGAPNYQWSLTGRAWHSRANALIGILVADPTHAAIIPPPPKLHHPYAIRAIPLGNRTWGFLLGERAAHDSTFLAPTNPARIWYAEWKGTNWIKVEAIPFANPEVLLTSFSSDLIARNGEIHWVVPIADGIGRHIVEFRRGVHGWSARRRYTPPAAYAAAEILTSDSLIIAVVAADTTLPSDKNSLFLMSGSDKYKRIARGGAGNVVRSPQMLADSQRVRLYWLVDREANRPTFDFYTAAISGDHPLKPMLVKASVRHAVAVRSWGEDVAVIQPLDGSEVRHVMIATAKGVDRLQGLSFDAFVGAGDDGRGHLYIVGPRRGRLSKDPPVATYVAVVKRSCRPLANERVMGSH